MSRHWKKTISTFASLSLSFAALTATAKNSDVPQHRATVNISTALLPSTADTRQPNAVISGIFPNGCYSWDGAEVKDLDSHTHEVRAYANVKEQMCIMVLIPFSEEVSLGSLSPGVHTIRFVNGDNTYLERKITVR